MAIVPRQGLQNTIPAGIPLGASTVGTTNPNSYGVYLTILGGTVTAISINGSSTGVTAGTFLVNAGGAVNLTYSVAPTTFSTTATGLTPPTGYPFSDPLFQNFTSQQNLTVGGAVNPSTTDA